MGPVDIDYLNFIKLRMIRQNIKSEHSNCHVWPFLWWDLGMYVNSIFSLRMLSWWCISGNIKGQKTQNDVRTWKNRILNRTFEMNIQFIRHLVQPLNFRKMVNIACISLVICHLQRTWGITDMSCVVFTKCRVSKPDGNRKLKEVNRIKWLVASWHLMFGD